MNGKVYLVGAGPGGPEYLTLGAFRALEEANYILFDQLVSPELLAFIPPKAIRECVDELPGKHPDRFAHIHARMIEEARGGSIVVRLKSGDPMIFGRAGEEIEALRNAGISYEVIPGVTAGLAAAACLDIPLTHRLHSSSVTFVTGHECTAKGPSSLDWPSLAANKGTLVFYMGVKKLQEICAQLIFHGRSAETSAIVVQHAGRNNQRRVNGTLHTIPGLVVEAKLEAPAVLLVGPVVDLLPGSSAFESRSLFGRRILVTRPYAVSEELVLALKGRGAVVELCPMLEIAPPADRDPVNDLINLLRMTDEDQWLIFTSANGVIEFHQRLAERGVLDHRVWARTKIAAIGPATAKELKRNGLYADAVAESANSEGLAETLRPQLAGFDNRLFLLQAEEGRELLLKEFAELGIRKVPVYRQVPVADAGPCLAKLFSDVQPEIVTLTSPNIVERFAESLDEGAADCIRNGRTKLVTNAPRVSEAVRRIWGVEPLETPMPQTFWMVEAIETYFTSLRALSAR